MKNQNRQGAVLPFVAVTIGVLILFLGLSVELSWLYSTRFEAQSASDLSSRSALAQLYSNEEDLDQAAIDRAKKMGLDVYRLNFNRTAPITEDELSLGTVDENDEFTEITSPSRFDDITASFVENDQAFTSLLGTLIAKDSFDLHVASLAEAARVNLVLSLDASRSMNRAADSSTGQFPPGASSIHEPPMPGSRWFALQDSVESFLGNIGDGKIQIGMTTFGGGLNHRLKSPLDDEFSRIELELDTVEVNAPTVLSKLDEYVSYPALGYGTSIYDGLDQAIDVLKRTHVPAKHFIVLLTDGEQVADGRPSELVAAQRAADEGVTIFVIAYDVDERRLRDIADMTGGQIYSVTNAGELNLAFGDIAATLRTRITK